MINNPVAVDWFFKRYCIARINLRLCSPLLYFKYYASSMFTLSLAKFFESVHISSSALFLVYYLFTNILILPMGCFHGFGIFCWSLRIFQFDPYILNSYVFSYSVTVRKFISVDFIRRLSCLQSTQVSLS